MINYYEMFRKNMQEDIYSLVRSKPFINDIQYQHNINKEIIRALFRPRYLEQLMLHKEGLLKSIEIVNKYAIDGNEIDPEEIKLKVNVIDSNSSSNNNNDNNNDNNDNDNNDNDNELEDLYFFWNLIWWSTPYERSCGRRIRLLLWDTTHNAPFGLINLQSPTLNLSAVKRYLCLSDKGKEERISTAYWLNHSMYAQRVGALPPYNELLGSKMVALTLASQELREIYERKYDGSRSRRSSGSNSSNSSSSEPISKLLFITTTGAYGKSSVYERLKIRLPNSSNSNSNSSNNSSSNNWQVCKFIGYTSGFGTSHISEEFYKTIKELLRENGINAKTGLQYGSSRKLRLLCRASKLLGLQDITYHGIKRAVYIFEHVHNLYGVIHNGERPSWINFIFSSLEEYWKTRWCIPRSERNKIWQYASSRDVIKSVYRELASN